MDFYIIIILITITALIIYEIIRYTKKMPVSSIKYKYNILSDKYYVAQLIFGVCNPILILIFACLLTGQIHLPPMGLFSYIFYVCFIHKLFEILVKKKGYIEPKK